MSVIFQILFWTSAAALLYTYVGYPLLVYAVSRRRPLAILQRDFEPSVSVIVTAYNEENALAKKLENTLELDYPLEKLEIIVASDGSTDATDDIARQFADRRVRLIRKDGRIGKTATQNAAAAAARGDILVFSDATTVYQQDVLRILTRNFADETVGCAAGKLIYVNPNQTNTGDGARSYWNYETFIKTAESRACSLIGASGCMYAVRRAAYVPMYPEACSDFLIATVLYQQGLRTIYESEAVSVEETNVRADKELKMRVRVIAQTFTDLWRHRAMLNPLHSGFFAIELLSHKVLRYSVPFWLILIFAASAALSANSTFFLIILLLQSGFYAAAIAALLLEKTFGIAPRILALPQYFVLANAAIVLAAWKFWRGERFAAWQPIRETEAKSENEIFER